MFTRRDFLRNSLAGTGLIAWGLNAPRFLARAAAATPDASAKGAKDTILVVVQLTGGNDGLNTVIPYGDPEGYGKLRNALRIPTEQIKKVNDHVGLHPSLDGFAGLLEDNALCIVQGVGYPNPDESHFRSMDIWQAAGLAKDLNEGWLGKALKRLPSTPAFHCSADNEPSPLAFDGAPVRVPSLARLEDFQLRTSASSSADSREQKKVIEAGASLEGSKQRLLDFVQQTAVNTYASSKRLQELAKNYEPKAPYPNTGLANRLKLAAQLIEAGLGARIFYASIDGFDTHANQLATHANLLKEVSDAMTAFFKDISARGHRDRVLMMTFSEFGRRAKENGSKGTDHGSAAPMFLVGGKVRPGVVGDHPSMTDLYMNKLKHHTDFRQVYAAVLDEWLGVPSKEVLGQEFKPVQVFKS